jgi:hypothetical protein
MPVAHDDVVAITKGLSPALKDVIERNLQPPRDRISVLEHRIAELEAQRKRAAADMLRRAGPPRKEAM